MVESTSSEGCERSDSAAKQTEGESFLPARPTQLSRRWLGGRETAAHALSRRWVSRKGFERSSLTVSAQRTCLPATLPKTSPTPYPSAPNSVHVR